MGERITTSGIRKIINNLQNDKSDGVGGIYAEISEYSSENITGCAC